MRAASPPHERRLQLQLELHVAAPAHALDHGTHDLVQAHLLRCAVEVGATRELHHVAHERGELRELRFDVAAQALLILRREPVALAQHLDVRLQARDRRAQLVAGIGDQVTLRLDRALERLERGVEALRKPRQLVAAADLQPLGEIEAPRERLRARREPGHRHERRACHEHPEERRQDDAADRPRARAAATGCSRSLSTSVSGRATSTAPRAPSPEVSTRSSVPPTRRSLKERPLPERAIATSRRSDPDRRRGALSARNHDAAAGRDELDVAGGRAEERRLDAQRRGRWAAACAWWPPGSPSRAGGTGRPRCGIVEARAVSACARCSRKRSISPRRSERTAKYTPTAAASTASATEMLAAAAIRARRLMARASRTPRRARCG